MVDITTDQNFPNVTLKIVDKSGVDAKVDGIPVWSSSDETVVTAVAGVDGMTGVVNTIAAGTARITISADADLGAGIKMITGVSEDIVVIAGNVAEVMTLNLGTPAPKVP